MPGFYTQGTQPNNPHNLNSYRRARHLPGVRVVHCLGYSDAAIAQTNVVFQRPWRRARGDRGRARADPGGHCFLYHCRRRPQGWSLRLLLYLCCHRLRRRSTRHDLGSYRCDGTADGHPGKRSRASVFAGSHLALRGASNPRWIPETGLSDALCFALGSHRLCECIGDSDFHGAVT